MTGCFSSLFRSKSQRNRQKDTDSSARPEYPNEDTKSEMSAATACYCTPTSAPYPSEKPPAYTPALASDIFRPEVLEFIEKTVDSHNDELRKLSLKIHGMHPLAYAQWL
jgi:hypothetical protein